MNVVSLYHRKIPKVKEKKILGIFIKHPPEWIHFLRGRQMNKRKCIVKRIISSNGRDVFYKFFIYLFLVVLGFELRASCVVNRCPTASPMCPDQRCLYSKIKWWWVLFSYPNSGNTVSIGPHIICIFLNKHHDLCLLFNKNLPAFCDPGSDPLPSCPEENNIRCRIWHVLSHLPLGAILAHREKEPKQATGRIQSIDGIPMSVNEVWISQELED
jgi:hypothetical protein